MSPETATGMRKIEIGDTAIDVVRHIAYLNPQIISFDFSSYKPIENVAEMKVEPSITVKMVRHYPPKNTTNCHADVIRSSESPNFDLPFPENEVINIHSRVITPNGYLHIPMMDLSCDISDENLRKTAEYAKALRFGGGVVLQTGRSYHYYGFRLLSEKRWVRDFIAPSMLAEVCDMRYMAHKLKDGFITLRLTAGGIRNTEPRVVLVV